MIKTSKAWYFLLLFWKISCHILVKQFDGVPYLYIPRNLFLFQFHYQVMYCPAFRLATGYHSHPSRRRRSGTPVLMESRVDKVTSWLYFYYMIAQVAYMYFFSMFNKCTGLYFVCFVCFASGRYRPWKDIYKMMQARVLSILVMVRQLRQSENKWDWNWFRPGIYL